jgi:hypothetical protein
LANYIGLPILAFGSIATGGVLTFSGNQQGLLLTGLGLTALLALGVRNSWAIAIDVVGSRPDRAS